MIFLMLLVHLFKKKQLALTVKVKLRVKVNVKKITQLLKKKKILIWMHLTLMGIIFHHLKPWEKRLWAYKCINQNQSHFLISKDKILKKWKCLQNIIFKSKTKKNLKLPNTYFHKSLEHKTNPNQSSLNWSKEKTIIQTKFQLFHNRKAQQLPHSSTLYWHLKWAILRKCTMTWGYQLKTSRRNRNRIILLWWGKRMSQQWEIWMSKKI